MKFSREYTKLQDRVFTTIRNHDCYEEGQVIKCQTPIRTFWARVLFKFPIQFKMIHESLLQYDTDNPTLGAAEVIAEIQSFYRYNPPSENDVVTVYLLEKEEYRALAEGGMT